MLFADIELAARIERAECSLLAAAAHGRDALVRPLGGGVATYAGAGSPLNKVAGLGFSGPLDETELEAVERELAARDAPVQVELAGLADPSVGTLLTRRGYELVGVEHVLGRALPVDGLERPAPGPDAIEVAVSGPAELRTWIELLIDGFAHPDEEGVPSHESFPREPLERVLTDMAGAEGFVRYLARRNGEPAGAASLRLAEGVALLCGAATAPAHRRRGVQTALLGHRLDVAGAAGCDVAVLTTQPGSTSHANAQRRGFELLYARSVLVRGGA